MRFAKRRGFDRMVDDVVRLDEVWFDVHFKEGCNQKPSRQALKLFWITWPLLSSSVAHLFIGQMHRRRCLPYDERLSFIVMRFQGLSGRSRCVSPVSGCSDGHFGVVHKARGRFFQRDFPTNCIMSL